MASAYLFIIRNSYKMKHLILAIAFILPANILFAQEGIHYDESKVPVFTPADPLIFNDGRRVATVEQWEDKRRAELIEIFSAQVYGRTPKDEIGVTYEILDENALFLHGKATATQVRFTFSNNRKMHEAVLLLVLPTRSEGKVPVFIAYNYKGNHSTTHDPSVVMPAVFTSSEVPDYWRWEETDRERGCQANRWCYDKIIDRGYGVATMSYQDIYPDVAGKGKEHSITALFPDDHPDRVAPDEWQALGAWAWGLSRIADFLETQERVDMRKITVMGHSRHGKAALWAGAQDERFGIVISNNSGCGGAAMSQRVYGENIARITNSFPDWFCPYFSSYANNEANLPFDQHELVALIAPRKVYIASAVEDRWADPKGEFLSGYYAGPVYELYGLKGLETSVLPSVRQPIMNDIGYHIREGIHDVTDYDWMRFMDFADKHLALDCMGCANGSDKKNREGRGY